MKHIFQYRLVFFALLFHQGIMAQNDTSLEGHVSFITATHVYVKFSTTATIDLGDTLYTEAKGILIAALIVDQKSSISCVTRPLANISMQKDQKVLHRKRIVKESAPPDLIVPEPEPPIDKTIEEPVASIEDPALIKTKFTGAVKQKISFRLTAASFTTLSEVDPRHRFRHTLAFNARNINNTGFSFEVFSNYFHGNGYRLQTNSNLFDQLKFNALAISYTSRQNINIVLGRKINPGLSNMGVIDGLQVEWKKSFFALGMIAGARPDYRTFGFNFDLAQGGFYLTIASAPSALQRMSTIGFIEQRNNWVVDRRYIYLQHTHQLSKSVHMFFSSELDLYEKRNDEVSGVFRLTGLYGIIRYRPNNKLNISAAYDQRRNIIFFETFKNQVEQLIDEETRQGLRLSASYRITRQLQANVNANWRFQKSNINVSKNYNANLTYQRLPIINGNFIASVNFLETTYLRNSMYSGRYTRGLLKNKIELEGYYRYVQNRYKHFEFQDVQHIFGGSVMAVLSRNINFQVYCEGLKSAANKPVTRVNVRINYRL